MGYEWNTLSGSLIRQRYVLGELVSEREDSATFLTDLPNEVRVAVLEILDADSRTADAQEHRWAFARGLAHPHLVRIYDAGEEWLNGANFIYAVKERPDECLADVMMTRVLTVEEARQVVESILLCLEYLHQNSLAHGAVRPSSVMAVDGQVKLSAETVTDSKLFRSAAAEDMYSLGETIVEVLTRKHQNRRSSTELPESDPNVAELPAPFRAIAIGCLQPEQAQRWTPRRGLAALTSQASTPTSLVNPDRKWASFPLSILRIFRKDSTHNPSPIRCGGARAMLALAALAFVFILIEVAPRSAHSAKLAHGPLQDDRPSPIPRHGTADRASSAEAQAATSSPNTSPASTTNGESNWGVIAGTYKDFDLAQRFADSIQGRWKDFACAVYPIRGQAQKYYYVLLGSGLTRDAAARLQERATAVGLPGKCYVTKISEFRASR